MTVIASIPLPVDHGSSGDAVGSLLVGGEGGKLAKSAKEFADDVAPNGSKTLVPASGSFKDASRSVSE